MPIDENIASLAPDEDGPAAPPADATAPQRGRPWVKGQSGNPNGRPRHTQPSRARKAAIVAQGMLDRNTPELMDRVIGWGQGSDKTMLRLDLQRMVRAATRCRSR